MKTRLQRPIDRKVREGLNRSERWDGPDKGLIWCWERGRQKRAEAPELAIRAEAGELVRLPWKGGTEDLAQKTEADKKPVKDGSVMYLAMWQGLRNEDLDIDLESATVLVCAIKNRSVRFRAGARFTAE